MKRFISFLTAILLVLTMLPVSAMAADVRTVYLDPGAGNDSNSGLEASAPVKSVAAAYSALSGAAEGRIVFLSTLQLSALTNFPTHTIPVTLTSKTGAEGITSSKNIYFRGPTTLENMTLTSKATNSYTLLSGGGYKFTVGENVTTLKTTSYYFCLCGGSNAADCSGVDLTVRSGTWRNIYVGSHGLRTVKGNCKVSIRGVTLEGSLSVGYQATVTGDVHISVTDSVIPSLYACSTQTTGKVGGDITVTLGSGAKVTGYTLESNSMSAVAGTNTLILDGGQVTTIKKTSENAASGATAVLLKSGRVDTCNAAADTTQVSIPKGKTLTVGGQVTADTLEGSGTLNFTGKASLTAERVVGTVNCSVEGEVLAKHLYITAPGDADIQFDEATGIIGSSGEWTLNGEPADEEFVGLVLTAAPGITVTLYKGVAEENRTKVTPTKTRTGETNYYYFAIESGYYHYVASGTGYYKIKKNLYMTAAEAAAKTVLEVTPPKLSGEGWEQTTTVKLYTDEVLSGVRNSDPSQWQEYADIFTTPYFTQERTAYQMTTQDQMEAFIDQLDDEKDNLYVYNAGYSSGYGFPIDAIVITKTELSGAQTLEEAAALVGQAKPTILYRAHMHGSEPASGEAALAMLQRLDGALGEEVLDKINVVMIPRNSPDAAYEYTRNLTSGVDPNGDNLKAEYSETEAYFRVYDLFVPEIVFDGHEFIAPTMGPYIEYDDALIGVGFAAENSAEFVDAYRPMIDLVRQELTTNGLYYRYYSNIVNHNGASVSRSHSALQGTMFVLIESHGIQVGTEGYHRRMVSQVVSMQTMLEYIARHAGEIQSVVDAERQRIIRDGATYEESDQVLLELAQSSDESWQHPAIHLYQSGKVVNETITPKVWDTVVRSRIAPTAYVIPAGKDYTEDVLALMDKHNIAYTYLPAGAQVLLQQYSGTVTSSSVTDVALSEETAVTFGTGAYVFCKNQVKGLLLSALMEPDVSKSVKHGLAYRGLVPCVGGRFPIYRYIHDLNAEGFIDYTLTEVTPVEVTVYLDGENGLGTNDGRTEATPVKTLEQAYSLMDQGLSIAAEGSTATLVVMGMYDLGTVAYHFPAVGFPVTITGRTADDGFLYTGAADTDLANRAIYLHGDTTFRNIRLHVNNSYTNTLIFANGHKLVMGEGLNTTVNTANYHFTLVGGGYDYSDNVEATDITVLSGTWRMIYVGGYRGSVSGAARLRITNATVYSHLFAAYCGNVGSLEMDVSQVKVVTGSIYAGTSTANTNYKIGSVKNGSTVILREGVTVKHVYTSALNYGNIYGGAVIVFAGADITKIPVTARSESLKDGYITDLAILRLGATVTGDVTIDPDLELDLSGYGINGNLTVDGELTVYDSATDDYTVADGACGEITGAVTGTLVAKEGYVAAANGFHKFGGQAISSVSLRPQNAGIYYSTTVLCDEILAQHLESGVAVSLTDMPGADFETDEDTLYAAGKHGVLVQNILKGDGQDADRGIMDIYAATYVKLPDGTVLVSDREVAYSLYDILTVLQTQNPEAFASFCKLWNIETWF